MCGSEDGISGPAAGDGAPRKKSPVLPSVPRAATEVATIKNQS